MTSSEIGIALDMFFNSIDPAYQDQVKIKYHDSVSYDRFTIFTSKASGEFDVTKGKDSVIKGLTQLALDINYHGV